MATRILKRGRKRMNAALNKLESAIITISKQTLADNKHNDKFPDDKRELFSEGEGVGEAMGTLLSRIMAMKGIEEEA